MNELSGKKIHEYFGGKRFEEIVEIVCYTRLLLLPPPIQKCGSAEKARPLNSILELQFLWWVCFSLESF